MEKETQAHPWVQHFLLRILIESTLPDLQGALAVLFNKHLQRGITPKPSRLIFSRTVHSHRRPIQSHLVHRNLAARYHLSRQLPAALRVPTCRNGRRSEDTRILKTAGLLIILQDKSYDHHIYARKSLLQPLAHLLLII